MLPRRGTVLTVKVGARIAESLQPFSSARIYPQPTEVVLPLIVLGIVAIGPLEKDTRKYEILWNDRLG